MSLLLQTIVDLDVFIMNLIVDLWMPAIIKTFAFVTFLGGWKIVCAFLIITSAFFIFYKKQNYIFPLLVGAGGTELTVYLAKIIFHRARPDVMLVLEDSFAFPSGHAAISVAFYGFIAFVLIKHSKRLWQKIVAASICLILIVLIGFSRLYLGAHYFSDVVFGYFIGSLWLCIAIYVSFPKIFKRLQSC
ncbi:MAG: phosphatase PAP2 family protein [Candidatus Falkowbacteria bacterium]